MNIILLNLFIQNFGDTVFTMTKTHFLQLNNKSVLSFIILDTKKWIAEEQNLLLKNYLVLK